MGNEQSKRFAFRSKRCYHFNMNSAIFLCVFIALVFVILAVALKIFPKDSSFTIAIGAVIGANIYSATAYPIFIGGLVFGIDSIVYTIFAFCLLFMYINYGKRDMKVVLYTSIFSIFFTAFLFFMGNLSQSGYSTELLLNFVSYFASIVATFLAVLVMVKAFEVVRTKTNVYVAVFLALIVVSLVNSLIYFGLSYILTGVVSEIFLISLAGSYIGKLVASVLCLAVLRLTTVWNKNKKIDR